MAYTINRFDGSTLTVVEDGTIDNNTDIKLVGKNYAGYGEIQNENFVNLLENFANTTPPPRPISGQLWFDSDTFKLKFYDGSKFKTTGGAEVSGEIPAGLTEGDFWWDTENEQLYAYNGTDFILVGPQNVGADITQMQSRSILGTDGINHPVVLAIINGVIVYIISNEEFTISTDNQENIINGFDIVKKGITLVNTQSSTGGQTSTDHIFWGTSSNALSLNGFAESDFVRKGAALFDSLVSFSDAGFAVGDSNDFNVRIENDDEAVLSNNIGNVIKFNAKDDEGIVKNSLRIFADRILPGIQPDNLEDEEVYIGDGGSPFETVYANNFVGLSEKSSSLVFNDEKNFPDILPNPNTVAIRDVSGNLRANLFRGVALAAKYADLAEKYSTETDLPVGTLVSVCKHSQYEVCAANATDTIVGTVSENPAYLMNSEAEGQPIAFVGRVPVRILGSIEKGQNVYALDAGVASVDGNGQLIGIALETNLNEDEKLIECILKV